MPVDSPACSRCHAAIPADARFCPQCGARIGDAPTAAPADTATSPPAERRQVAILFADLSGYTRLSSTLDAEEVHRLLSRYFELVDGVIGHLGGTIDKHIGDAVMAVFGAPIAHGNDTERALRAAAEIHGAMATLTREFGRPLASHIGIASGEVVAADTGSATHRNYTMTGDAVNLAARLVEMARADETVISDDVYRALAHLIDADPQGSVPIRGLGRELPVWKLRALRASGAEQGALIGRENDVRRFRGVLDRVAASKTGASVLVCAEPGMGKTRLAEEFLAIAANLGLRCHAATVLDFGIAQGRDAIHRLFGSLIGIGADAAPAEGRAALDQAIADGRVGPTDEPFAADVLAIPQRAGSRYEAMDNDARTVGKLRTLAAVVERASAGTPLALLIEDVHWASPWVMACVRELAACAQRSRCVLVLTSRREGNAVAPAWPAADVIRFDLEPLAAQEALALARTFLTANPDVALRCVERAQGNPLFLTQLLRSGADGAAIPGTIQSVVLARLDGLPPQDKAALQAASVIGQRFELEVLRHLLQDPGYDGATLHARDLVRREAGDGGHWMFGHALIRDGAYASLLHSTRRTLHLRAADWYAGRDAALHAEHLDRADDVRAAGAYLRAAQAEVAALRIDSALRLLRRGAELDAPAPIRHALAALEGELCGDIGDATAAVKAFERALPLAGDDRERCAAWIGIAAGHRVTSTIEPAFAALDRADELAVRNGLDRELSRIHYLRGNLHFAQGNVPACRTAHERAREFAQRAGDAQCEAQALSGLGDAHYAEGTMRSAHAAFSRCVAICEKHGLARFAIMNNAMIAIIDTWLGDGAAALSRLARTELVARELQHKLAEAMSAECIGWTLVLLGRFKEAEPPLRHGLELAREMSARRYENMCLMSLAHVCRNRGAHDLARAHLRDAWAGSEQTSHGFIGAAVQGAMALMADGEEERRRALATGEALLAEGSIAHCHIWFYRDAIEASLESHAWSEAERYAAALEEITRAEPLPWTDLQIAIARALAANGRGNGNHAEMSACREKAVLIHETTYLPSLDAALARLPAH